MRRPWLPVAVVLVGALALGIAGDRAAWPDPATFAPRTAFTSGQHLAAALGDATWRQGRFLAPTVDLVGWPEPAAYRPVMWPTLLLSVVVAPLVAVNLAFVFIPVFNAWAGVVLARALAAGAPGGGRGQDRAAVEVGAAVTGAILAWHPWVRETLANGQLEQAAIGAGALVWAAALRGRTGSAARAVGVGGIQALAALAAPHVAIGAAVGVGVFALPDLRPGRPWRRQILVLASVGVATALVGAWFAGSFTSGNQVFWPKGSTGHPAGLAGLPEVATLRTLFVPPAAVAADTVHPVYLGLVPVAAALLGTVRGPRGPLLAAGVLVAFAFGERLAGPVPGPYALMAALSGSVAQSQSPYRFLAMAVVALGLAAGRAVRRPGTAFLLVAAAWGETAFVGTRPFPPPAQAFVRDPVVAPFLAGSGPILDLPLAGGRCPSGNVHYALEAARRLRPTPVSVATPSVYPTLPGFPGRLAAAVHVRPCGAELRALVAGTGFTGVVLHTHDPTCAVPPSLDRCLVEAFGPGEAVDGLRWWDPASTAGP